MCNELIIPAHATLPFSAHLLPNCLSVFSSPYLCQRLQWQSGCSWRRRFTLFLCKTVSLLLLLTEPYCLDQMKVLPPCFVSLIKLQNHHFRVERSFFFRLLILIVCDVSDDESLKSLSPSFIQTGATVNCLFFFKNVIIIFQFQTQCLKCLQSSVGLLKHAGTGAADRRVCFNRSEADRLLASPSFHSSPVTARR